MTTFAGSTTSGATDGIGTNAKLYWPQGALINSAGTMMYFADTWNNLIRTIALGSGN